MSLIIHSLLNSKWGFFPWSLTFCKASPIRFDELDAVGDHLYSAAFGTFVGFPLGMIEDSGNSDLCALVQVLFTDLRQALKAGYLDPASLLF